VRHIDVLRKKEEERKQNLSHQNNFFMKGKYIDTQILLAALSGGKKRSKKMAA